MKILRAITALALAAFIAALAGCAGKAPRSEALRLHILANSDSAEDQAVKLKVRDAILACFGGGFEVSSEQEAKRKLLLMGDELQSAAENALAESGMDYGVQLVSGEFDFPDRMYGDELYPAGRYDALRVVLGDGAGHNWWCVMFPPLCIIESEPGGTAVNGDGTLAFRSFFAEIWRELFSR
ncbi:MAG: stage II sporulation protein R [Clostridia bacterium]|nr:stage II sporulation protein R [Clostridia bacterium]